MGADCHDFFIEQRVSYMKEWRWVATIYTDRDYDAFGVLAGVRGVGEHIEPRGYPSDMSWVTRAHASPTDADGEPYPSDCHSASWLTTDEMVEAQMRYMALPEWTVSRRPYEALELAITVMRMVEQRTPEGEPSGMRAVFCFDN